MKHVRRPAVVKSKRGKDVTKRHQQRACQADHSLYSSLPPLSFSSMRPFPLTLLLLSYSAAVHAGAVTTGGQCNQGNNRLQTGTFQFWSECTATNFCSDAGICEAKRCRKDDFPFGYAQDSHIIPDKCPKGQFCPDEGTDCQALLAVGSPCQMNRDGKSTTLSYFSPSNQSYLICLSLPSRSM